MASNVSVPSDAQYYPSTTSASRTDISADTSSSSDSTVLYSPTGKVLSKSINWMRYFSAKIYSSGSSPTVWDVSNLRCTFQAQHYALGYPNTCTLTVYNLNAATENTIINEGTRLVLEAGYQGNPGQIFDGNVVMCTRSRQNGTDMVLNILAMDGSQFYQEGYATFTLAKGQSARDVVNNVANKASHPIQLGYASPQLDALKLSKAFTAHGSVTETLDDMARTVNGTWFIEGGKLYIVSYADSAATLPLGLQAVTLTPDTGLLGNPQQQEQGVQARSLLNPSIMLYGLVHIPNVYITEQMVTIGSYSDGISTKYPLDKYSVYRVLSVNHNGDTRGNAWYSDIVAISQSGKVPETLINGTSTLN